MKTYTDFVDDLPNGVSRNVFKIPQRFRSAGRATSVSRAPDRTAEDDESYARERYRRPKLLRFSQVKIYTTTIRGRAARNALSYAWEFVPVQQLVCDVDTLKYPFELVRKEPLPDAKMNHEEHLYQQQYWQQWEHQWQQDGQQQWLVQQPPDRDVSNYFLDCFDGDYILRTARALREITIDGSMLVRACFGRTLYRLHSLHAGRSYQLSDLTHIRHPSDVQSSWSNVCDDKAPAIQALISELNRADSDVDMAVVKLKLTMRCCLNLKGRPQYAKLLYFRQGGKWVFAQERGLSDVYACHDLSLDNRTNFRIKICAQYLTPGRAWWGSIKDLVLFDESNGDPLTTKVSLVSCSSKDLRIEFVSIKSVSGTVDFRGLVFQLSKKQGCTSLQAFPPRNMLAKGRAGESFEFLVTRLVEILDELS